MEGLNILLDLEFVLRIIVSGFLGAVIGYERKYRGKGAGVRTHMIVALAAALLMIISKYGFNDVNIIQSNRGADPSRVASQIVSGVGFLGAGMIYVHKNSISGLTTAAGIWATAGIGMAIGAGMYCVGILSGIIVLLSQVFLHKDLKFMQLPCEREIKINAKNTDDIIERLLSELKNSGIQTEKYEITKNDDSISVILNVVIPNGINESDLLKSLMKYENINSIKM